MKNTKDFIELPVQGYVRAKDVIGFLGISKAQLYRLINDEKFPRPIKLSENISVWDVDIVRGYLGKEDDSESVLNDKKQNNTEYQERYYQEQYKNIVSIISDNRGIDESITLLIRSISALQELKANENKLKIEENLEIAYKNIVECVEYHVKPLMKKRLSARAYQKNLSRYRIL